MKKTFLFFVLLVLSNLMLAQKIVPAIVVVDGTLPESIGFTCVTRPGDTLSFPYFRSHFKIDDLISLLDGKIKMEFMRNCKSFRIRQLYISQWHIPNGMKDPPKKRRMNSNPSCGKKF